MTDIVHAQAGHAGASGSVLIQKFMTGEVCGPAQRDRRNMPDRTQPSAPWVRAEETRAKGLTPGV